MVAWTGQQSGWLEVPCPRASPQTLFFLCLEGVGYVVGG